MYIRKLTYKKEDVDCKLCTEYRGKKHPCPHDVCPFIAERIEAGAVTYWDAVNAMLIARYGLTVMKLTKGDDANDS